METITEFRRLNNADKLLRFDNDVSEHIYHGYYDRIKRIRERSEADQENFYDTFKKYEVIVQPNPNIRSVIPVGNFEISLDNLRNEKIKKQEKPSMSRKAIQQTNDEKMMLLPGKNFMMEINS